MTVKLTEESFTPRTIVKNENGAIGVVCRDLPGMLGCNGHNEVSVVFDGSTVASGTDWESLEIIGTEEAKADLEKCGAGRGEDSCIFLSVDAEGPGCERFGPSRWDLIFRTMKAKRNPSKLYPDCQFNE